jgi:hypothetical protein
LKVGVNLSAVGVVKTGVTESDVIDGDGELIVKLIVPAITVSNTP